MNRFTPPSINLFKGKNVGFMDRFIKWALSAGRLIVILTEIVALSAFLYRFSLDRQLIDLSDKIKQESAILTLLKNNESKYRNLQERLKLAHDLTINAQTFMLTFEEFVSHVPTDMSLNTVNFSNSAITMNGSVRTINSLTSFIKVLKEDPKVKSTKLDKLENKISSSTILFSLTTTLHK